LKLFDLELCSGGHALRYQFDNKAETKGLSALLRALDEAGVAFEDLQTKQSSLEEIVVTLVHEAPREASA
jgi:ABC-2 type transport system ATP-binding protein